LCAPADAHEDFLDGAIETITILINSNPTPCTNKWLDHQRTKKYAKEILEFLLVKKNLYLEHDGCPNCGGVLTLENLSKHLRGMGQGWECVAKE